MSIVKNVENEKKYLIEGLPRDLLSGVERKNIIQYYLNIKDFDIKEIIKLWFGLDNIRLRKIAEARIRIIDNKSFVFTVKSGKLNKRYEKEKDIRRQIALRLIKSKAIGFVAKTRFVYKGVEIDFLKNRDLCLAEMEYDNMTEQEVDEYVKSVIKEICEGKAKDCSATPLTDELVENNGRIQLNIPIDNINIEDVKIVDVTNDPNYKNKNLMIPCNPLITTL